MAILQQFAQQLINGLVIGLIYSLIALGYTMVFGILGFINFAHGDVYMIGAFLGLVLLGTGACNFAAAMLGAGALGAAYFLTDTDRFLAGYLAAFAFWLSVSLGALFYVWVLGRDPLREAFG